MVCVGEGLEGRDEGEVDIRRGTKIFGWFCKKNILIF